MELSARELRIIINGLERLERLENHNSYNASTKEIDIIECKILDELNNKEHIKKKFIETFNPLNTNNLK
jgi:hypothetical protein